MRYEVVEGKDAERAKEAATWQKGDLAEVDHVEAVANGDRTFSVWPIFRHVPKDKPKEVWTLDNSFTAIRQRLQEQVEHARQQRDALKEKLAVAERDRDTFKSRLEENCHAREQAEDKLEIALTELADEQQETIRLRGQLKEQQQDLEKAKAALDIAIETFEKIRNANPSHHGLTWATGHAEAALRDMEQLDQPNTPEP